MYHIVYSLQDWFWGGRNVIFMTTIFMTTIFMTTIFMTTIFMKLICDELPGSGKTGGDKC